MQYGELSPPFGETRMKAVELVLVLFRSNYPEISAKLLELRVLPTIMDLFFEYEWNNMLHGLVESIIRTILDSRSEDLKTALFEQAGLVTRFLEAYGKNADAVAAPKGCRLGYMGHLVRTCNALHQFMEQDEQLRRALGDGETFEKWNELLENHVMADNEAQQTMLGGHRPSSPFGGTGSDDDVFDAMRAQGHMDDDDEFDQDPEEYGPGQYLEGDEDWGFPMHMQQAGWQRGGEEGGDGSQGFDEMGDNFADFEAAFGEGSGSDEDEYVQQQQQQQTEQQEQEQQQEQDGGSSDDSSSEDAVSQQQQQELHDQSNFAEAAEAAVAALEEDDGVFDPRNAAAVEEEQAGAADNSTAAGGQAEDDAGTTAAADEESAAL